MGDVPTIRRFLVSGTKTPGETVLQTFGPGDLECVFIESRPLANGAFEVIASFSERPKMTEQEWLTCDEQDRMFDVLGRDVDPNRVALVWKARGRRVIASDSPLVVHDGPSLACDLIREIFGNPWEPYAKEFVECRTCIVKPGMPILCDRCLMRRVNWKNLPNWLTWQQGTVPSIAQRIYDDEDFGALPILADALEEAGCAEKAILDHLRGVEKCPFCPDGFHTAGGAFTRNKFHACGRCDGKGTRSANHIKSCWALNLFLSRTLDQ